MRVECGHVMGIETPDVRNERPGPCAILQLKSVAYQARHHLTRLTAADPPAASCHCVCQQSQRCVSSEDRGARPHRGPGLFSQLPTVNTADIHQNGASGFAACPRKLLLRHRARYQKLYTRSRGVSSYVVPSTAAGNDAAPVREGAVHPGGAGQGGQGSSGILSPWRHPLPKARHDTRPKTHGPPASLLTTHAHTMMREPQPYVCLSLPFTLRMATQESGGLPRSACCMPWVCAKWKLHH
jgi:hypothetical protein